MNGLGNYLIKRMIKADRHSQEQDIIDERRYLWPRFGSNILETVASFGVLVFVSIEIIYDKLCNIEDTITTYLSHDGKQWESFINRSNIRAWITCANNIKQYVNSPPPKGSGLPLNGSPD